MPRKRKTYLEKFQEAEAARALIRSDKEQTEARYDEIVALRMLLLDIQDILQQTDGEYARSMEQRIDKRSAKWGKKGDCV